MTANPNQPRWTIDYIARAVGSGSRLYPGRGEAGAGIATHVSFFGGKVVLHEGPCACKCHDPSAGIITHDQPCCEPITYES